jgi:large subunit ribosomal protein L23
MAFFDRFKHENKGTEPVKPKAAKAKKPSAAKSEEKAETKQAVPAKAVPPKDSVAFRVLVRPLVSEKTVKAEKSRQFVFVVARDANKVEIKKAVEKHYRVHVTGVNVVNVSGKKVSRGLISGKRKDWRKAYVTVRAGESITF